MPYHVVEIRRPGDRPPSGPHPAAFFALFFGIASVTVLPGVAALPAIILGHVARAAMRREPDAQNAKTGRAYAVTGLALGYFSLVSTVIFFMLVVFFGLKFLEHAPTLLH